MSDSDYESEEQPIVRSDEKQGETAPDPGIGNQIEKYERRLKASEQHNGKFNEQTKINQRWAGGKLANHPYSDGLVEGDDEDGDVVRANLIHSTNQAMMPHIYASKPEPAVIAAERANPVDGDISGEGVYQNIRSFCETSRIALDKQFQTAGIKRCCKKSILKVQTAGLSVFKVSYQKEYFTDPLITNRIDETTQDISEVEGIQAQAEETKDPNTYDLKLSELKNALEALKTQEKRLTVDNSAIDVLSMNQVRFDPSVPATELDQGDWVAHFVWRSEDQLTDEFQFDEDRISKCTAYTTSTNRTFTGHKKSGDGDTDASEAKQFRLWEMWDKRTSTVYTFVEGDDQWSKPPVHPNYMGDRWYPFFPHYDHELDGASFPISDTDLLIPLQKEYDDTRKQLSEHRQAAIPVIMADAGKIDPASAEMVTKKIGMRDVVFVDTNGAPMKDMFYPGPSTPLNPGLYDVSHIHADIQWVSGLQDADRGGVIKSKTLGEAEIMERGLANRTSTRRDLFEEVLSAMYSYGFYLMMEHVDYATIVRLAGKHAYWPEHEETKTLYRDVVDISIRAGSTGRPDEGKNLKNWMESLEMLLQLSGEITEMRLGGIPDDQNYKYRILEITLKRMDERIDIEEFLPKPKIPETQQPGQPGQMPGGMPGQPQPGQPLPPELTFQQQ